MKPSTSEFIEVRGRRCHVRCWGPAAAPKLFLLHGWMDVSATFQFLVDAFERYWRVLAPDWRGFGMSQWNDDAYWFPDYMADLDAMLAHYSPEAPACLAGHSMGGNAASLYAGIRPERVARLVTLEGFGLRATHSVQAPERYAKWLADLRNPPPNPRYADRAEFAARLRRANPRLEQNQAEFLALHLGEERNGAIEVAADPYHRLPNPVLYRIDDAKACWRKVTAPVLWVAASESFIMKTFSGEEGQEEYKRRIACFADVRVETVADAGHNMQHDQPQTVARLIEEFIP